MLIENIDIKKPHNDFCSADWDLSPTVCLCSFFCLGFWFSLDNRLTLGSRRDSDVPIRVSSE